MKRLCSICARGGSKGVENKNIRLIAGKPLIAHSIEQAIASGLFSAVSVSSDSDEILNVSKQYGAHILIKRPESLATDTAAKLPVIQHCFLESEKQLGYKFELLVDLDCTSPLRDVSDIQNSVELYENNKDAKNLITGMLSRRSPYFNLVQLNTAGYVELAGKSEKPILRRQDAPICYDMNASIYIWRREELLSSQKIIQDKTMIYEMPENRSIDIDSPFDFEIVSYLMEKKING
ncbi:MAG: cytidylyltransferase domain-containing protein [Pseudobdellovibrio sp.]